MAKNLIIFECDGRTTKIAAGDALTHYTLEQVPDEKEREFRRKPVAFNGEVMFTSMLIAVTIRKPFKSCFLQGHGEPSVHSQRRSRLFEIQNALQDHSRMHR